MQKFDPDLFLIGNKVLDFGPSLAYPLLCSAYTVEKLTLWQQTTEKTFQTVPIRATYMPRARVEGNLYRLSDEELLALDNDRQLGVEFERKRLPVFVPYQDERGNLGRIYAYVYLGLQSSWIDRIDYNLKNLRNGTREIVLSEKYPDNNPLLHNRYSFLPPLIEDHPTVADLSAVEKHCRYKNRKEVRRLARSSWWRRFLSDE